MRVCARMRVLVRVRVGGWPGGGGGLCVRSCVHVCVHELCACACIRSEAHTRQDTHIITTRGVQVCGSQCVLWPGWCADAA